MGRMGGLSSKRAFIEFWDGRWRGWNKRGNEFCIFGPGHVIIYYKVISYVMCLYESTYIWGRGQDLTLGSTHSLATLVTLSSLSPSDPSPNHLIHRLQRLARRLNLKPLPMLATARGAFAVTSRA